MLENFKNTSLLSKIVYLFALLVFLGWSLPTMLTYFSNEKAFEKSQTEINRLSSQFGLNHQTVIFDSKAFKESTEAKFEACKVLPLENSQYSVTIKMKREDIEAFNKFIETLSLRYYVNVKAPLTFEAKDEMVTAKMIVVAL